MTGTLIYLAALAFLPALTQGQQSACATLGVNCSHPTIQQTPSNSGGHSNEPRYSPPPTRRDYADDANDTGYHYLSQYWHSGSQQDYQQAEDNLQVALSYIPGYAPAEYNLCQLYGRAEVYADAIYACQIAAASSRQFRKSKEMKKWLLEDHIPWLILKSHEKAYNDLVKKYDADCGTGEAAGQLGNGIAATIEPEKGLPVDLRADTMAMVHKCQAAATNLTVQATSLNNEIDVWNKKQSD
ncbi:MAG TPA: hypothetical protein VIK39_01740 [Candidatus Angelobacter sp.]